MTSRRDLIRMGVMAALLPLTEAKAGHFVGPWGQQERRPLVKPKRVKPGDTIGLVIPSSATWNPFDVDIFLETLSALGLKAKMGKHVFDRYGYLAGKDEDRAADLNAMFADPEVDAIHCVRGGWGAARILPLLDFDVIAANPKPLIGFSDITALLLGIHSRTGLVTFHGPTGSSDWNNTNIAWMKRVLWEGEACTFQNPRALKDRLVPAENRTRTITSGKARGPLLGGNLTVLTTILGSSFIPNFDDAILFVEDVDEAPYRIDRMFVQLKLTGILETLKGVVWGTCANCGPGEGFGSLTIPDVLNDHIKPLGIPAFYGSMFGHISTQFTLPLGVQAEIDADAGTVKMLEAAVV